MSLLTYTIRADHPRLFCIAGDKTAITLRTNAAAGWQHIWDSHILTGCTTLTGLANSSLYASSTVCDYFLALGLAGWIDNVSSYHTKLLSAALELAQTETAWPDWPSISCRLYAAALGVAYTFLRTGVITFSDANRKILGDGIVDFTARFSGSSSADGEYFHGHASGDWMGCTLANIAIAGESGTGFNYTTVAAAKIEDALDFWYGAAAGDRHRMEVIKYFSADGGILEGSWYGTLAYYEALWFLQGLHTGFVRNTETPGSLQLNGVDYEPWTSEDWVAKIGEYFLHAWYRNDGDHWAIHDTDRSAAPWFHQNMRTALAVLMTQGGTYRKQLRWLREAWEADSRNSTEWSDYVYEVAGWDPADANNASVAPKDASPAIAKSRLFDPPGSYWYHSSWDHANGVTINIEVPQYHAYYGHSHLCGGGMQIALKNDVVMCHTGCYRGNLTDSSQYGGLHHRGYNQQSIAISGVPLVHKPGLTHTHRNELGARVAFQSGLGGQLWRKWYNGSAYQYEPYSLTGLLTDGSNNAWTMGTVEIAAETADYTFIFTDVRRAYLYEPTEYGTASERVTCCEIRDLIIPGESVWPIILRITRVTASNVAWIKRQHFHSYRQWNESYPHGDGTPGTGDTKRGQAAGFKNIGKVVIDLYNWQELATSQVGGGGLITGGFYARQFYYDGVNYPPTVSLNDRWKPDIGNYRWEIASTIARNEEYFVTLIMPMGVGESPPAYEWVDIEDWYGVKFAATGAEYQVHKTLAQAKKLGETEEDTTPPTAPVGLAAVAGDTQVVLTWTPNVESDMASYDVYKRVKV